MIRKGKNESRAILKRSLHLHHKGGRRRPRKRKEGQERERRDKKKKEGQLKGGKGLARVTEVVAKSRILRERFARREG